MREADWVCALDTGSTDGTPELLERLGAIVAEKVIDPWRFDVARNEAMKLIPPQADICVSTDLDEAFTPAGAKRWKRPGRTTPPRRAIATPGIFCRTAARASSSGRTKSTATAALSGNTPCTKSSPTRARYHKRSSPARACNSTTGQTGVNRAGQYLPLLELSVREDSDDDRNMHYLGREYFFYGRWKDCVETLKRHLACRAPPGRMSAALSMRYIAMALEHLGEMEEAERWFYRAVGEAPYLREPWVNLARFLYQRQDWPGVAYMTHRALQIQTRPGSYINAAEAWGPLPWDLASIALYHLGQYKRAPAWRRRRCASRPATRASRKTCA